MSGALPVFWACTRVGLLGFGGGPSVLPLMQRECVHAGLIDEASFLEGLAAGQALPGPIATKMAVWVGWQHAGLPGAIAGLVGMALPSAILMVALGALLVRYREHPAVAGALRGVKPAIVSMLLFTAWELAPAGLTGLGTGLVAGAALLALILQVHPGWVIAVAAAAGAFALRDAS